MENKSEETKNSYQPSDEFNKIIGFIEDIVISAPFQELQSDFFDKNCNFFINEDENKFMYMEIFNQYITLIERFILDGLTQNMADINMNAFLEELRATSTQFDGEIYEFLYSLSDFQTFKTLILDFKDYKENKSSFSALDDCFTITKI